MADTCVKCGEYFDVPDNSFFWTSLEPGDYGLNHDGSVCDECFKEIKGANQ